VIVTVRLFAGLRERAGSERVHVELPDGARVADLLAAMDLAPRSCVVAINREYADAGSPVSEDDEVALEHRVGSVPLSEPSVIVAASAPHRAEAFNAARALIDRVKAEAPIWKVEVDGADRRRVEGSLPPLPR